MSSSSSSSEYTSVHRDEGGEPGNGRTPGHSRPPLSLTAQPTCLSPPLPGGRRPRTGPPRRAYPPPSHNAWRWRHGSPRRAALRSQRAHSSGWLPRCCCCSGSPSRRFPGKRISSRQHFILSFLCGTQRLLQCPCKCLRCHCKHLMQKWHQ